ncbi:hypothetical protein SCFA_380005 [anaerobic digester metagenome]|uniref:Uncharacterized protein n=1 Tax=anaerobic digester metagenome TaxID=1263854 RepID=A0A485M6S4_9ZZZZ
MVVLQFDDTHGTPLYRISCGGESDKGLRPVEYRLWDT